MSRAGVFIIALIDLIIDHAASCIVVSWNVFFMTLSALVGALQIVSSPRRSLKKTLRIFKVALRGFSSSIRFFGSTTVFTSLLLTASAMILKEAAAVTSNRTNIIIVAVAAATIIIIRSSRYALKNETPGLGLGLFARLFGLHGYKLSRLGDLQHFHKVEPWIDTSEMDSQEVARLNDLFEEVTAAAWRSLGCRSKLNGASLNRSERSGPGDGGVDVLVWTPQNRQMVVSCKRYASPIGVKEVRDIFAVSQSSDHRGAVPALVTTVGFTAPAEDFAKANGVILLTMQQLLEAGTVSVESDRFPSADLQQALLSS